MKKFFMVVMTILFAVNITFVNISADTAISNFSKEEAHNLIWEAQIRFLKIFNAADEFYLEDVLYYKGYYVILNKNNPSDNWSSEIHNGIVTEYVLGSYPQTNNSSYNEVTSFDGDIKTEADLLHFIEEVFEGDLVEKVKYNSWGEPHWVEESGKIFYFTGIQGLARWHEIIACGDFISVTSDKAVMEVTLGTRAGIGLEEAIPGDKYIHEDRRIYVPSIETVEFTKTADGWRISGGTAFEVMLGEREPSPNTGDNTLATAALLVTIALATIIPPFAISKKRRVR